MQPGSCCCNILWLFFFGWELALLWLLLGILWCCTIIGIPFGIQAIKLGCFILWPFGSEIAEKEGGADGCDCCLNFLWIIFGGLIIFIISILEGVICCITIVGIPCGIQLFKFAQLALTPFGRRIVESGSKTNPLIAINPTVVVAPQPQYGPPIATQPIYYETAQKNPPAYSKY